MQTFEYRVVPAPERGAKVKGLKRTPDRFAHALTEIMNRLGADGWEYLRAETLPCEERSGLTGRRTTVQNMLVFRRRVTAAAETPGPRTERTAPRDEEVPGVAPGALARSLSAHAPEGPTPRITAFGRGRSDAAHPDDPANVPRGPASTG